MTRTENALLGALSAILFSISFLGLYDHYRDRPYVEPPHQAEYTPREVYVIAPASRGDELYAADPLSGEPAYIAPSLQ